MDAKRKEVDMREISKLDKELVKQIKLFHHRVKVYPTTAQLAELNGCTQSNIREKLLRLRIAGLLDINNCPTRK